MEKYQFFDFRKSNFSSDFKEDRKASLSSIKSMLEHYPPEKIPDLRFRMICSCGNEVDKIISRFLVPIYIEILEEKYVGVI